LQILHRDLKVGISLAGRVRTFSYSKTGLRNWAT
jgi:hypothetical protein